MAVTSQAAETQGGLQIVRPGRAARAFVLGALIGVAVVMGALAGVRQVYVDRILPGISVGGISLGGLTRADARAALATSFGQIDQGGIMVGSSAGTIRISYGAVGRAVDIDALVDRAMAVGRGGTRFDEIVAGARGLLHPTSLPPVVGYDPARLATALDMFERTAYQPSLDAAVIRTGTGFTVQPATVGTRVDARLLLDSLDAALRDPSTGPAIKVKAIVTNVQPAISDEDALRSRRAAERIASDLQLVKGHGSWTIPAGLIRSWIRFDGTGARYAPSIQTSTIPKALRAVKRGVAIPAGEAQFLHDRAGHLIGVSASHDGRALDVGATVAAVTGALEARAQGAASIRRLTVHTVVVGPKLTTAEAAKKAPLMVRVGGWTTFYDVAAHNGFSANITVPTRRINGTVVRPGQVFDFWKALGEVSFRTGYRLGGAIVNGHSVEGKALAGGICSASTTLFNAAARGGFEILTRSPHFYYIKRYPLGLDATVSGSQTMRFRNDTRYPILIRGFASPGVVRYEIWSVPNGRTVTWSRPSVWNFVPGFDTTQMTSSLPRGVRERVEWPADGMDVSVTRTVRDASGAVIHVDTWVSHYHRMIGITRIGL